MAERKSAGITVRLDGDLKQRLTEAALKLDLSENDIARHAIRAAVNAIEANDYKIELPLSIGSKKSASGINGSTPRPPTERLAAPAALLQPPALHGSNEPEGTYKTKKGPQMS